MHRFHTAALLFLIFALPACSPPADGGTPWRFPPAARIVAVGDLHGDLDAARRALTLAGAIDDEDRWIGGTLVLVQTGDQVDRGNDERAMLDLFVRLAAEAARAGGAVHALNGNHELMNAALDFRYVTPGGFAAFADAGAEDDTDSLLASLTPEQRGRAAAFRPGGSYARILAARNTVIIIGDNLFVHGGVLPAHLDYGLERMNGEVRTWLLGEGPFPEYILKKRSLVWSRNFSLDVDESDCDTLRTVLSRLGVKRLIAGHTDRTEGIISYCDGAVWCIDAGISSHYGGTPQVLEIRGDSIRILREERELHP